MRQLAPYVFGILFAGAVAVMAAGFINATLAKAQAAFAIQDR